jgi:hypothetical protein
MLVHYAGSMWIVLLWVGDVPAALSPQKSLSAASKNRYIRPEGRYFFKFAFAHSTRTKPRGAPGSKPKAC